MYWSGPEPEAATLEEQGLGWANAGTGNVSATMQWRFAGSTDAWTDEEAAPLTTGQS